LKIAVILPAFNEAQTIAGTIEDFHGHLPSADIWVINNRSSDATAELARKKIHDLQCPGGVIDEPRPGKGNAIRRAFRDIQADIYLLADADLTYPAYQAELLLAPILSGEADMVVGDRHVQGNYAAENKRALHGFGNRLVRGLVNSLFAAKLSDVMSGYRAFSRSFVKSYPILVEGFEIETDMTLHALDKRFRIAEVAVNYKDRPEGSFSKLNTFRDGLRVLKTIGNILRHYRPLLFFGSAAAVLMILGLVAGYPVVNEWVRDRFITHVPLAILATGLALAGIVMAGVALILDSLAHQQKLLFERESLRNSERK